MTSGQDNEKEERNSTKVQKKIFPMTTRSSRKIIKLVVQN